MADESEKPAAAAEEAPKKKSKLPLIISAVVLLAGGGAGAWYLGMLPFGNKQRHAEATAAVESGGGHGEKGEKGKGEVAAPMLPLETFIANLADEGGSRYLKATFQIEFLGTAVPPEVTPRLPKIRDLLLTLLSSKSFDDVRTPEGKQQLREEIIARVNQVVERDVVKAVYFTEFIVQ